MEVINQINQTKSDNMEQIFNGMFNQVSEHIISCLSNKYGFDKDEAMREIMSINSNNNNIIPNNDIIPNNYKKMTINELSTSNNDNKDESNVKENTTITLEQKPKEEPKEEPKKKRGRPKKVDNTEKVEANNTNAEEKQNEEPKKKRGRPKKEKTKVNAIVSDDYENNNTMPVVVSDLLSAVRDNETTIENATQEIHNYYDNSNNDNNSEIDEEEMEEEEIQVEKITINGTEYCIDSKNRLYDPDSTELIGQYNRDDNVIV